MLPLIVIKLYLFYIISLVLSLKGGQSSISLCVQHIIALQMNCYCPQWTLWSNLVLAGRVNCCIYSYRLFLDKARKLMANKVKCTLGHETDKDWYNCRGSRNKLIQTGALSVRLSSNAWLPACLPACSQRVGLLCAAFSMPVMNGPYRLLVASSANLIERNVLLGM